MERKPYPSDLTDAQWRLIAPLIPAVKPGGRPRKYEMREVMDALLYVDREGRSWRALPHDFPHWKTCYNFFRRFEADGTWDAMVAALRDKGVPHAYLLFPGEQHGFRQAANFRAALDGELSFYAQVLGFELPAAERITPITVR